MNPETYLRIKTSIIKSFNLVDEELFSKTYKPLFKDIINSPRRYCNTNNIEELIEILEVRGALSENDIDSLQIIAKHIPNNNQILKDIANYRKNITKQSNKQYTNNSSLNDFKATNHKYLNKDKLEKVKRLIIQEIGPVWRDLGRNLHIPETALEDIHRENESIKEKIEEILEYYENSVDEEKWLEILCKGLERSRRKDLSKQAKILWDL